MAVIIFALRLLGLVIMLHALVF